MKILVVFTGGTIGSALSEEGYFAPEADKPYVLTEYYRRISGGEVEFVTEEPYRTLSENLDFTHIAKLIACIKDASIEEYDGVIVTHGTDTIQYTASALTYAFADASVPVVLVSSNYILDDPRANGFDNFKAGVEFIGRKVGKGVFISYRNDAVGVVFHRGSRLLAHQPYSDELYSIRNSYYGIVRRTGYEYNTSYHESDDEMNCLQLINADRISGVMFIQPYVGMRFPAIADDDKAKAVILGSYHSGTLNTASGELRGFTRQTYDRNIPVFMAGAVSGQTYESTKRLAEYNIKILPQASPVAMYMKAVMLASEGKNLIEDMYRSLGGDILR